MDHAVGLHRLPHAHVPVAIPEPGEVLHQLRLFVAQHPRQGGISAARSGSAVLDAFMIIRTCLARSASGWSPMASAADCSSTASTGPALHEDDTRCISILGDWLVAVQK